MEIFHPLATSVADGAMTILVHCIVSPSSETAFLALLQERLVEFEHFPGTKGHMIFKRAGAGTVEISILQSFSGKAAHEAWQVSPEFARWREAVAPAVPTPSHVRRYTGMESFFVSAQAPDAPPRWKMAILLLIVVFPISFAMSEWGASALAHLPTLVGSFATSIIMVALMTYILVPALTKLFPRLADTEKRQTQPRVNRLYLSKNPHTRILARIRCLASDFYLVTISTMSSELENTRFR